MTETLEEKIKKIKKDRSWRNIKHLVVFTCLYFIVYMLLSYLTYEKFYSILEDVEYRILVLPLMFSMIITFVPVAFIIRYSNGSDEVAFYLEEIYKLLKDKKES